MWGWLLHLGCERKVQWLFSITSKVGSLGATYCCSRVQKLSFLIWSGSLSGLHKKTIPPLGYESSRNRARSHVSSAGSGLKLPSIAAADEFCKVLVAAGPPVSFERRNQAKTLWDMVIPELHQSFSLSRGGQHWYQWAIEEAREGSPLIPDSSKLNSGASPNSSILDGDLLDPFESDLDDEESESCVSHTHTMALHQSGRASTDEECTVQRSPYT